jgi:hypothetical protein
MTITNRPPFSLDNFSDGFIGQDGRFRVYFSGHPRAHKGYIKRSIAAYELYHNIEVPRDKVIHHVDGNRLNDSKENLQLLKMSEHSRLENEKKKKRPEGNGMVRIHGVVLEADRAGRRAERCKGIHLVDEAGNVLGSIWFEETNELKIQIDPRINVTLVEGGTGFTRQMSPYRVGHYYQPDNDTVENNLEVIKRHREKLEAEGIQFDMHWLWTPRAYPWASRSR